MDRRARALLVTVLVLLAAARALAAEAGRRYLETHGNRRQVVEYVQALTADGWDVTSTGDDARERAHWTAGTGLVSWEREARGEGTSLRAVRSGDSIQVRGTLRGEPVDRTLRVDGAPWYQVFGPGMADLLPAGTRGREFWVIDPDRLSAHKMQVRRAGRETVSVDGREVVAERVHFSPAGALSALWGADYWYRLADAAWVYARLPEDGGLTVSTLQEQGR
jgi:hypothetical protein